MSLIQAPKRTKTYTHTFPDVTLVFEPNAQGHVVCDVQDQSAVDRLLSCGGAFVLYGEQPEPGLSTILTKQVATLPPEGGTPPADSPYLLKDESGAELDLRPMSDEQLREFATANGLTVHHAAKGNTIRDKIVDFLSKAE